TLTRSGLSTGRPNLIGQGGSEHLRDYGKALWSRAHHQVNDLVALRDLEIDPGAALALLVDQPLQARERTGVAREAEHDRVRTEGRAATPARGQFGPGNTAFPQLRSRQRARDGSVRHVARLPPQPA